MKNKINILFLLVFCLGMSQNMQAQFKGVKAATDSFFRLGIKGGVNLSTLNTSLLSSGFNQFYVENAKNQTGYVAGVYARLGRNIFLEPELLFSAKGGTFNATNVVTGDKKLVDINYTNIDVPLLLGIKLGHLHLLGGPVASYQLSANESVDAAFNNYLGGSIANGLSKSQLAYQVGAGIDLLGITLDVKYEGSLTDIAKDIKVPAGVTLSQKPSLVQVTVGIKIL
ncbi:MAG: porin family protein [Aquirufa sp.]